MIDSTNDPSLRSWIPAAPDSDFPIQNLPFGVFCSEGRPPSVGVAIGDRILDLAVLHENGMFAQTALAADNVFAHGSLNPLMAKGRAVWAQVRGRISDLLRADNLELRDNQMIRHRALVS
ncbi:MAG: fumarylacetoacetase, partial [Candidatus Binataceae bacterium]